MDDDGGASPLTFRILPVQVQARQNGRAVPDLVNPKRQRFRDAQAGADRQDQKRMVAPAVGATQVAKSDFVLGGSKCGAASDDIER